LPNRFAVGLCPLHAAAPRMREALQTLVTALTAGEKWPVYLSDAIGDARACATWRCRDDPRALGGAHRGDRGPGALSATGDLVYVIAQRLGLL
jgi:hypothetical protein